MKRIIVERIIEATSERIWDRMTDPAWLQSAGTGTQKIEGDIGAGSRFKLWADAAPGRAFAIRVTVFDRPKLMVWESGMPLGLFHGRRVFDLSPADQGTRFHMHETFTGLMLPLIWRAMPDLTPSFEQFADVLAKDTERQPA